MKNADSNSFFISFLGVPAEPSTTARTQNGSWVVASPAASLSSWGVAIDGPFIGDLSIKKMVTFSSDMLNYRSVRTDTHGIQYIVRNAVMIHLVSPLLTKGFSKRGWSSITFFQHSVFYLAVLSGNMVTPISCGYPGSYCPLNYHSMDFCGTTGRLYRQINPQQTSHSIGLK